MNDDIREDGLTWDELRTALLKVGGISRAEVESAMVMIFGRVMSERMGLKL